MLIIFVLVNIINIYKRGFYMVKNVIQEERMKNYFIDSARQIIKGEGIKALSVRTVAERAGYSYATLYNYFENLRELILVCVEGFLKEAEEFIENNAVQSKNGIKGIESKSIAFSNFFIQYPDIFTLIFLEEVSDISNDKMIEKINTFFNHIFKEEWEKCFIDKSVNHSKIDELILLHKNMLIGILIWYINRRTPKEYSDFIKLLKKNINAIF